MGEVIEQRRRYYSGLDADKATIPAGGKTVGDHFFATDTKVLYFWDSVAWIDVQGVLIAKAETGFGRYVLRNPAAADKVVGDFTTNGVWQVHGLDLSGIVPAGAVAVALSVTIDDDAAGSALRLRRDVADYMPLYESRISVANVDQTNQLVMPIDSDRLIDYWATNVAFIAINLSVVGWFT